MSMVFTNAYVRVATSTSLSLGTTTSAEGSTGFYNLSAYVMKARLTREFDEKDDTTMGLTDHSRIPGLESWEVELDLTQTFNGSIPVNSTGGADVNSNRSLDDLLWDLTASKPRVIVAIRACNTARASDNPEYWGQTRFFRHSPMDGAVGDLLMTNPVFRSAGNIARLVCATG